MVHGQQLGRVGQNQKMWSHRITLILLALIAFQFQARTRQDFSLPENKYTLNLVPGMKNKQPSLIRCIVQGHMFILMLQWM